MMGGWDSGIHGWGRVRRETSAGVPSAGARWSAPEIVATVVAFAIRWELGLALLGLKLWQQASGYRGNVFSFARDRWDVLVAMARGALSGTSLPFSLHVGPRSSGNHAFDTWRHGELSRIETERERLRSAEREFAAYRDELLQAKDREDFDRFMRQRG